MHIEYVLARAGDLGIIIGRVVVGLAVKLTVEGYRCAAHAGLPGATTGCSIERWSKCSLISDLTAAIQYQT